MDWSGAIHALSQNLPAFLVGLAVALVQLVPALGKARGDAAAQQQAAEDRLDETQTRVTAALSAWADMLQAQLADAQSQAARARSSEQRARRMFQALHDLYVLDVGHEPPLSEIVDEAREAHGHALAHISALQQQTAQTQQAVSHMAEHVGEQMSPPSDGKENQEA